MKIKGWEKISGYTYKGYTIVNPIHNAGQTSYNATILNLNLPQKPKWELSLLTPTHKFRTGVDRNTDTFYFVMWDDNKNHISREISKQRVETISIFRNEFEEMIDEMLRTRWAKQSTSAPISHSLNSGIVNHINNNGNTIQWQSVQAQALKAAKDLQDQIDKLNTPLTPF